jgi:O-antigen/teichoic acid export membrane protein
MLTKLKNTSKLASHPFSSLKSRVLRAGSFVLIGYVLNLSIRLLGNLIMARLLAPDLFGIMAIATAIHFVIALLADIGLFQATIQSPNGQDRSFLNTAWTLQASRGSVIWGVCTVVAVCLYAAQRFGWLPLGSVYAVPILPAVIVTTAFSAVILGFRSIKAVVACRNLDLKRVTLIELISQMVGLSVAIWLGWVTHSIWSFIAGSLVSSGLSTLLSHLWLDGPADRFAWDRRALYELWHFGKWVFLSSAVGVLALSGDRLLLGAWVGPAVLGYYSIAFSLATMLDGAANRLFSTVSLAALSEVARRQPERFPALYFRARWPADATFVGTAGFLFAAGEWIIRLMYDERYAPAGPMLQLLSFGLLFGRYVLTQNAYLALGRPGYVTAINVVRTISLFILVPGLFYGFGIQGAIVGIAFHMTPAVACMFWFNRWHGLNNFRLELAVLGMWPIGWVAGVALLAILHV